MPGLTLKTTQGGLNTACTRWRSLADTKPTPPRSNWPAWCGSARRCPSPARWVALPA